MMYSHFDALDLRLAAPGRLQRQMDSVFHSFGWPRPSTTVARSGAFSDRGDHYRLRALIPGAAPDTVSVTVLGRDVTITGARSVHVPEGFEPQQRERSEIRFERTYRMPGPIAEGSVKARLVGGVLTISVMKADAAVSRSIDIEVN